MRGITFVLLAGLFISCGEEAGQTDADRQVAQTPQGPDGKRLIELEVDGDSERTVVVGDDFYFDIKARYDDGSFERLRSYEIEVSNSALRVDGIRLYAEAAGAVEVVAKFGELRMVFEVIILEGGPAAIRFATEEFEMTETERRPMPFEVLDRLDRPLEQVPRIRWSRSNPDIVEISDDGLVTALEAGVVTATAEVDGTNITAQTRVRVLELVPERLLIEVDATGGILELREPSAALVTAFWKGAKVEIDRDFEWSSSSNLVLTPDPNASERVTVEAFSLGESWIEVSDGIMSSRHEIWTMPAGFDNQIAYAAPCSFTLEDQGVSVTSFEYDEAGRLTARHEDANVLNYTYEGASWIPSTITGDVDGDGVAENAVIESQDGRINRIAFEDADQNEVAHYSYGNTLSRDGYESITWAAANQTGSLSFSYDSTGRLDDYHSRAEEGNLVNERSASYAYRSDGRLDFIEVYRRVSNPQIFDEFWRYDFTWNPDTSRVATIEHTLMPGISPPVSFPSGVLYTDRAGNWLRLVDQSGTTFSWTYECAPAPPQQTMWKVPIGLGYLGYPSLRVPRNPPK